MIHINVLGLCGLVGRRLSRAEASERLGISTSTFDRRVRTGALKVEHDTAKMVAGKALAYVSLIELGRFLNINDEQELLARLKMLPPVVEPVSNLETRPAIALPYQDAPVELGSSRVPDIAEPGAFDPSQFRDSFGHALTGNAEHRMFESQGRKARPDTTSHMHPALVGDVSAPPNPVDSDATQELWHPGHIERKGAMYANSGVRQPSEQEQKKTLDRAAIRAAFRQGWSR